MENEVLFSEGEVPKDMFIIIKGHLGVFIPQNPGASKLPTTTSSSANNPAAAATSTNVKRKSLATASASAHNSNNATGHNRNSTVLENRNSIAAMQEQQALPEKVYQSVGDMRDGASLGEISLINNLRRTAMVSCCTHTQLLAICGVCSYV